MRPTIFLFFLVRKERRCRARYQKEKIANAGNIILCLNLSLADIGQLFCPVRTTMPLSYIRPRKASLRSRR